MSNRALLSSGLTALLAGLPAIALAQDAALGRAENIAGNAGLRTDMPAVEIIGVIINAALGLLGIVMVMLVIYAGYLYLTAQGDDDKVADAKKIIRNAVIGLVIIMSAYAISTFVISNVTSSSSYQENLDAG
jgi:hypothetical protein